MYSCLKKGGDMLKGSKMKLQRLKEGLSQEELAFITNIKQPRISNIETGMAPTTAEAITIANTLNCTIKKLFKTVRS